MDDTALLIGVAPGAVAIILSIATFVFTQRRAQQIDNRAAAKDTVDLLARQNSALHQEIADLRKRVTYIERQRHDCERERAELLEKLVFLREQMLRAADETKPDV